MAPRPTPGPRKREAEVLNAAVEVFRAKGYAAATIQDVADHVGVLKGSLYYYIRSKEELLSRVFDGVNAEARGILESVAQLEDASARERLRAYVARYTYWYLTHLERVGLYFSEWRHLSGELLEKELQRRAEFEQFIRTLIEQAQADGEVGATIDARHATFFLLGGINSAATWYRPDGADSPEVIAESYADMAVALLNGERVPEAGRSRR